MEQFVVFCNASSQSRAFAIEFSRQYDQHRTCAIALYRELEKSLNHIASLHSTEAKLNIAPDQFAISLGYSCRVK
jgi:hypothetical protein